MSMAYNLDDFGFRYVRSQYPGEHPNLRAELVPSLGAPHQLGDKQHNRCKRMISSCTQVEL